MLILMLAGCIETTLGEIPTPPVATPPALPEDDRGDPPNWNDCFQGFVGHYSNLSVQHPDVEPLIRPLSPPSPDQLDWWENTAFQEFSPNLDFGGNWWPVDEGLEGDPAYFSVRFTSWLRAWDDTTMTFTLGSADDAWILIGDEVVFSSYGIKEFEPRTYSINLEAGQYPLEVLYAHRSGESGFRFRVLEGDVSLCYAEYNDDSGE